MQWWLDELEHSNSAVVYASPEDSSHYEMQQNLPSTVGPLLGHTMWNQSAPYNDSVPEVDGKSCPIGCLATALGQILKYYEYPSVGTGIAKTYTSRTDHLTLSSDFNVPYDWDNILDEYDDNSSTQSQEAVAHLMIDLAILCEMDFSPGMSGAYASTARAGLQRYMGYDEAVRGVYRSTMAYEEWENLLKNELANYGPFFFSAQSSTGGHAFVCDGYNQDNFFHINWGWSGKSNGYFLLSGMNPKEQGIGGSSGGYFYYIEANIGLRPKDNLDAGDVDRNMMSIERVIVPQNTFQTTVLQELKLQLVRNTTGTTYYGAIALQLYQESNNSFVKSLDKVSNVSLKPSYYWKEVGFDGDFSGLSDGNYYISPVLLPLYTSDTVPLKACYPGDKIPLTIQGTTVTLKIPKFAVKSTGLQIAAPSDTAIYTDSPLALNLNLYAGSKLYNGMYALEIESQTGQTTLLDSSMVLVRSNDTAQAQTRIDCPNLDLGTYTLKLYLDTLYRVDGTAIDSNFLMVDTLSVEVLAKPDTTEVELTSAIYCNNVRPGLDGAIDSIYTDDAYVHVPIVNYGGYGACYVKCILRDSVGKKTYTQTALLSNGQSTELVFDLTLSMFSPQIYHFQVKKLDAKSKSYVFDNDNFADVYYFMSEDESKIPLGIDETTEQSLQYFNHTVINPERQTLSIYTLTGGLMYQGKDTEISLESWDAGLYIVKTTTEVLKVIR